ncbi:hypothetical protein C8R14_10347 [Nitrosomonas eutropha]|nr:hypothetical protein C8R14_10347 [Nitrosomonas eutropha]SEI54290.1 hypothetical protein SAMN05216318_10547 [Nitrosomonas eutropha]
MDHITLHYIFCLLPATVVNRRVICVAGERTVGVGALHPRAEGVVHQQVHQDGTDLRLAQCRVRVGRVHRRRFRTAELAQAGNLIKCIFHERLLPWSGLVALIELYYSTSGCRGEQPLPLKSRLYVHIAQIVYNYSDPGMLCKKLLSSRNLLLVGLFKITETYLAA